MKVKFGDLTVRQIAGFCDAHIGCRGCPFSDEPFSAKCHTALSASDAYLEAEIDIPDDEEKNDAEVH